MSSQTNQSESSLSTFNNQSENAPGLQTSDNSYFDNFLSGLEEATSLAPLANSNSSANDNVVDSDIFSEFNIFDSKDSIFDSVQDVPDLSNSANSYAATDVMTTPLALNHQIKISPPEAIAGNCINQSDPQHLVLEEAFDHRKHQTTGSDAFEYLVQSESNKESKSLSIHPKKEARYIETSALQYRTGYPALSTKKTSCNHILERDRNPFQNSFAAVSQDDDICDISSPSSGCQSEEDRCSIISVDESTTTGDPFTNNNSIADTNDFPVPEDNDSWRSYLEPKDENQKSPYEDLYKFYKVPKEDQILPCSTEQLSETNRNVAFSKTNISFDSIELFPSDSEMDVACQSGILLKEASKNELGTITDGTLEALSQIGSHLQLNEHIEQKTSSGHLTSGINYSYEEKSVSNPTTYFCETKNNHVEMAPFNVIVSDAASTNYLQMYNGSNNVNLPIDTARTVLHLSPISSSSLASGLPRLQLSHKIETQQATTLYSGLLFEYTMEAPKSLKQKKGEPSMSYLNKGQFYCISLRATNYQQSCVFNNNRVTSVIQIVFGHSKPEEEQLRHWKYWHSRQHTAKQRIIDIADYKQSFMISDIDEFAYNAVSFTWNLSDTANAFITCNCLSTDFSAQKGVKGLPLLLQIDTFIDKENNKLPLHRGVCQLKVFCDKGAERKIRDEEKKANKKKQKNDTNVQQQSALDSIQETESALDCSTAQLNTKSCIPPKKLDIICFVTAEDFKTPAVYFIPENTGNFRSIPSSPLPRRYSTDVCLTSGATTPTSGDLDASVFSGQFEGFDVVKVIKRSNSTTSPEDGEITFNKLPRLREPEVSKTILLYIRKESEEIFDAVMLREPTLNGLKNALQEKYNLSSKKIARLLTRSKKGVLVNVDDTIVRHYDDEDTFVIDIVSERCNGDVIYAVTLSAL